MKKGPNQKKKKNYWFVLNPRLLTLIPQTCKKDFVINIKLKLIHVSLQNIGQENGRYFLRWIYSLKSVSDLNCKNVAGPKT